MQILIEISKEAYEKIQTKSMLISASAIEEVVDAVKHGKINVTSKSCTPIIKDGVVRYLRRREKTDADCD